MTNIIVVDAVAVVVVVFVLSLDGSIKQHVPFNTKLLNFDRTANHQQTVQHRNENYYDHEVCVVSTIFLFQIRKGLLQHCSIRRCRTK